MRSLYFKIFSASFLITFLPPGIATSINKHVPFFIITGYNVRLLLLLLFSLLLLLLLSLILLLLLLLLLLLCIIIGLATNHAFGLSSLKRLKLFHLRRTSLASSALPLIPAEQLRDCGFYPNTLE